MQIPENRLFYLSVAPEFFDVIASNIKAGGLASTQGSKRLIIEKPFGRDLQSARELNEKLSHSFEENEIYRIDHYLGKPMVQNLEVLKYANPVLQELWTNRYIANVQITASETVGVEERAGYYDHTGAMRDMFQNHMLQLLMMFAIQVPKNSPPDQVLLKKEKVIKSLRPLNKADVVRNVVRGQYGAGEIQGKPVIDYLNESGIAESSMNDTYLAARLWIDNDFWKDIPFYIRTGKRMEEKSTKIVIEFKEPLDNKIDLLIFEISTNEVMTLQLASKDQHSGEPGPIRISFPSSEEDVPEAYENLIHDALRGDPTFFAHWDEVELSWQWVQPIIEAFEEHLIPPHFYSAGSFGPNEADLLLAEDGNKWWNSKTNKNTHSVKGDLAYEH